jgi:1,4-alpha-glucan branching enzyme
VVISNFTPVERNNYQIGLPVAGDWTEILNTDAEIYGGGNRGNMGAVEAASTPHAGHPASVRLTLPPLSTIVLCGPKPNTD